MHDDDDDDAESGPQGLPKSTLVHKYPHIFAQLCTHDHACSHMRTHAHTCPSVRWPTCTPVFAHAHTSSHMLTPVHACSHMLTHVHTCLHVHTCSTCKRASRSQLLQVYGSAHFQCVLQWFSYISGKKCFRIARFICVLQWSLNIYIFLLQPMASTVLLCLFLALLPPPLRLQK